MTIPVSLTNATDPFPFIAFLPIGFMTFFYEILLGLLPIRVELLNWKNYYLKVKFVLTFFSYFYIIYNIIKILFKLNYY